MIFLINLKNLYFVNPLLNMSTLVLFDRIQLESELLLLQSKIAQEKEDFNKELVKVRGFFLILAQRFY